MSTIASIFNESLNSPVISISIILLSWFWAKIFTEEWDQKQLSISYADCVNRKQWWRIITGQVSHNSFIHLIINLLALWSIRRIEITNGSFFFIKYSALIAVIESLISFLFIYFSVKVVSFNRSAVTRVLWNLNTVGCSGLILAWVTFYASQFNRAIKVRPYLLLSMIPINPVLGPVSMVMIYYFVLPRSNMFSTISGLIIGFLLSAGLIKTLPDYYWSLCFLVDLVFLSLISVYNRNSSENNHSISRNPSFDDSDEDSGFESLPVLRVGDTQTTGVGSERQEVGFELANAGRVGGRGFYDLEEGITDEPSRRSD